MLIVSCIPEDRGWTPIKHMVSMAAHMLEAQVVNLDYTMPSRITQAMAVLGPEKPPERRGIVSDGLFRTRRPRQASARARVA